MTPQPLNIIFDHSLKQWPTEKKEKKVEIQNLNIYNPGVADFFDSL